MTPNRDAKQMTLKQFYALAIVIAIGATVVAVKLNFGSQK